MMDWIVTGFESTGMFITVLLYFAVLVLIAVVASYLIYKYGIYLVIALLMVLLVAVKLLEKLIQLLVWLIKKSGKTALHVEKLVNYEDQGRCLDITFFIACRELVVGGWCSVDLSYS